MRSHRHRRDKFVESRHLAMVRGNLIGKGDLRKDEIEYFRNSHYYSMNDHFGIHVLQLPYWLTDTRAGDDKERWIHFFREGENMDINNLPQEMDTEEMRQALGVLDRFAKNKDEYLLYLSRLDAVRHERTWESTVRREKERREQAEERALKAEEQKEQLQKEKEELIKLLKQAGIENVG